MKLTIQTQDVSAAVGELTLSKSRSQAAATLTVDLYAAAGDTYFLKTTLAVGQTVRLTGESGETVFLGAVAELRRTPKTTRIVAWDRGVYLSRNELTGVFSGSGGELVRQIAARLGIPVGTVDAQTKRQTLIARAGDTAFALLRRAAGDDREIRMEGTALTVRRCGGTPIALGGEQFLSVESVGSLRRMVNRCLVRKSNGAIAATAQSAADIAAYGQFQAVESLSGTVGSAQSQANAALSGKTLTAEAVVFGNSALRCGGTVTVEQSDWGLSGTFTLTAVTHRWQAGGYTTELSLERSN